MPPLSHRPERHDFWTLFALSAAVWAVSNAGHEAIGHGGACVGLGGSLTGISSSFLHCDLGPAPTVMQEDLLSAAATGFNLVLAAVGWVLLRRAGSTGLRILGWIALVMNVFYSGSYIAGWFFGPTLDWAIVLDGQSPQWLWKLGLCGVGLSLVAFGFKVGARGWRPFVGSGRRLRWQLALVPYFAAIATKVSAGFLNSVDGDSALVLLGSFGATGIFLVWMPLLAVIDRGGGQDSEAVPSLLARRPIWIVVSSAIVLAFVLVLGPGLGSPVG